MLNKETIARGIQQSISGKNPDTTLGKNTEYASIVSGNVSSALNNLTLDDGTTSLDKTQEKLLKSILDTLGKIAVSSKDTEKERRDIRLYLAKLTASAEIKIEKLEKEVTVKEQEILKVEEELKKEIEEKKLTEEEIKLRRQEIEKLQEEKKKIEEERNQQKKVAEEARKLDPGSTKQGKSGKEVLQDRIKGDLQKIFPGLSLKQEEGESFGGMLKRQGKSLLSPMGMFDAVFGKAAPSTKEASFETMVQAQRTASKISDLRATGTTKKDAPEKTITETPSDVSIETSSPAEIIADETIAGKLTVEEREHLSKNLGFDEQTIEKIEKARISKNNTTTVNNELNVNRNTYNKNNDTTDTNNSSIVSDTTDTNNSSIVSDTNATSTTNTNDQLNLFDEETKGNIEARTTTLDLQNDVSSIQKLTDKNQLDLFSSSKNTKLSEILDTTISEGKIEAKNDTSIENTTIEAKMDEQINVLKTIADTLLGTSKTSEKQLSLFEQQTKLLETQTKLQKEQDAEKDREQYFDSAKEEGVKTASLQSSVPEKLATAPVEAKIETADKNETPGDSSGDSSRGGGGGFGDLLGNVARRALSRRLGKLTKLGKLGKLGGRLGKMGGGRLGKIGSLASRFLSKGKGKFGSALMRFGGKRLMGGIGSSLLRFAGPWGMAASLALPMLMGGNKEEEEGAEEGGISSDSPVGGSLSDMASMASPGLGSSMGGAPRKAGGVLGKVGRGALSLGKKALGGIGGALSKGLGMGKGLIGKGLTKGLGKGLLKGAGKSLLKKIPGIGLVAGLGFGASRLMGGDWKGALGEVASGAASIIPGVGTAASAAIDAGLAVRDATAVPGEANTGQTLENMSESASAAPMAAPAPALPPNITNNFSSSNKSGGGNASPASIRPVENSFLRFQDKRVTRV